MSQDAYPLAWPDGWPRTAIASLKDGRSTFAKRDSSVRFGSTSPITFGQAKESLLNAVHALGGKMPVISTNFQVGRDGFPIAGKGRRPEDEGIAVYFTRAGKPYVMARDAYHRAEDNMRSLALALESLHTLERHGGGVMTERAFQGFVALPSPKKPHEILGVPATAGPDEIKRAHRAKIVGAHPDQSGTHAAAAEINAARDAMLKAHA